MGENHDRSDIYSRYIELIIQCKFTSQHLLATSSWGDRYRRLKNKQTYSKMEKCSSPLKSASNGC